MKRARRNLVIGLAVVLLALAAQRSVDAAPGGCKAAGKHCRRDGQCCPGLLCSAGGTCQESPGTEEECTSSADCPSDEICSDGVCCFSVGRSCTDNAACCAPAVCNKLPGQIDGSCCVPSGGACTVNLDCCSNVCDRDTGCF
jgi:hypothetical protein